MDAATNTDTNAVMDEKLKEVEKNMNNVFYELKKKGNIIHSTYSEIAKIRESQIGQPGKIAKVEKSNQKPDGERFDVRKSKLNVNQPEFVPRSHVRQQYGRARGGPFYRGRPWGPPLGVVSRYHSAHPAYDPAIVTVYGPAQ